MFPRSHQDLLNAEIAILVTLGRTAYPQVTAVWFLLDDDGVLKLSLKTTRQKVKNLQEHRECTLFIIDRTNPERTLEVRANAEISPDADYAFADKIGMKYGVDIRKKDRAEESRAVVTLRPVKINTHG